MKRSLPYVFSTMTVLLLWALASTTIAATLTDVFVPQYIQGLNTTNTTRIPYVYRVALTGLTANASYRFFNAVIISTDNATSNGAGNMIYATSDPFTHSSTQSVSTAGAYSTFTTDATGSATLWLITEPTANATRFIPGITLNMRILLNDGAGGGSVVTRLTTTNTLTVENFTGASNLITGLRGVIPGANPKDMVLLYDNVSGTGRPISSGFIESDGFAETASFAPYYVSNVDGVAGAFGTIMLSNNATGIRRIEIRSRASGSLVRSFVDANGIWPSGASTVNQSGGATAVAMGAADFATALNVSAGGSIASGGTKDFGHVNVSGAHADVVFTISNNGPGSSSLTVSSISGANASDFTYVGGNPTSIGGYDGSNAMNQTFTVRFNPSGVGTRNATLTITSLDASNPTYTINLSGSGDEYGTNPINNPNPPQNSWTPPIPNDPTTNNQPPVGITFPAQNGAHSNPASISVAHTVVTPTGITGVIPATNLIHKFWTIIPSSENFTNATLTLYFTAADLPVGIPNPITASPRLYAVYSGDNGATWRPVDGIMGPDGNGLYSYAIDGLTHFSVWGIGNDNVLPVELSSFTAYASDGSVSVQWRTETETNNSFFRLYRSTTQDVNGEIVAVVPGQENSATQHTYQYTDRHVINGTTYYYRLADVGSDGLERIHPIILSATPRATSAGNVPTHYELEQNFPNPFNPETEIRYSVPEASHVRLTVVDITGTVVANLYEGMLSAGNYKATFNGSKLPSGVYFYRLETDNYSAIRKMTLIK